MIGKTISHYEVLAKLGEGGMGVVYKARDTHLDRFVAIKVLPPEKVTDPQRKARFVQEAKSASALNHPNIITIYDIDRQDGVDFIAMEYVAGKTLDQIVPRKGMRLNEVLKVAVQIAGALSRAHAAGIIHRDLKPGNILVDEHGLVKVLDFGLAKLTEKALTEGDPTRTLRPTTEEGTIVGTVAYMSPEQAEGKPLDARSDIFSFGAVLYEMITGHRAFQGNTPASTLAAVLKDEPKPASQVAPSLPKEAERVIRRCLRKDPGHRFQHMDDVEVALAELKEESDSGVLEVAPAGPPKRRWAWVAVAAVAAVLLGAGAWYFLRPKPAAPQRAVFTQITSDPGLTMGPVLSPDGTRVAYASDRSSEGNLDIWVQQVATGDRLRLTQNEADERDPAFSPDGNRIAYRSEQEGGGIYVVSTLGGEPKRLVRGGRGQRFSPDGKWIAYWVGGWGQQGRVEGGLFVIPSEGGQPRHIRTDFKRAAHPLWLPDGRHLLFGADQGGETADSDVWVTSVEEGAPAAVRIGLVEALKKQGLTGWSFWQWIAQDSGGGYLLLSVNSGSATNIWRVPISSRTFQVSGPAEQLTFGAARQTYVHAVPVTGGGLRMVFASIRPNNDIWSLPLDANRALVKGPLQRITDQESPEIYPAISEDGRKLVYQSYQVGVWNIWARDLVSGKETRVNTTPGAVNPIISRDGRRIAYEKAPDTPTKFNEIYMVTEGEPVLICNDCFVPISLTRDGGMLIDEARPPSLRVVMTAERRGVSILKHPTWGVTAGRLSPDERWIAFHSTPRIDARQVYVAPFRGPVPIEEKEWVPVTDGLGMERYADWSPDGNTLYFLSERDGFRCIRAQRLDPASKRPVGPPLGIYHLHHTRLSLMTILDPFIEGFHVAADKAVFAIQERTGNIWMTELPAENR